MGSISQTTYGFIGLGQMGHGMAKNIRLRIPDSFLLVVYDVNQEAVQRFIDEHNGTGVRAASSPKEVAELADVIMTSVPQAPHVRDVFLHEDRGLLAGERRPGHSILFLELSTIDAGVSAEVAQKVIDGGWGDFVDAPCSGGAMGAEKGALSFMVGCDDAIWPRVLEICRLMGKDDSIFHCGKLGSGLKTKLLNNYLSSLTALATAETYNIGIRSGLDVKRLDSVINASSGMNFNSKINNPVPGLTPGNAASKGYAGGFSLELCLGVLELGVKAADDLGTKTVLGHPMLDAFSDAAKDVRFQGRDSKVIYKWLGGEDPVL
ncbi:hypothetical protein FSOLCH5_013923 [Fusarium solani]|uniref:3-hydroxyisobutyrate dehydrogenase n=1 Tax=Fusarium solani TaxID=169388 RepID=A0A9P9H8G9_FUSSL|nr:NAD binding domain of 6-phosphogluconate dehydrogenase-domain-containing protein [Fusarium solani]KAH7253114.1 NAD binding domain of 6-phosphogluconate dehydrogenase-domain-containing protein [Fusarium solani]